MAARERGRPRDEAKRQAILAATRSLLVELGYDRLSIEAIAERAGVGRQTVYRWWPSKSAVVAEGVLDGALDERRLEAPNTGDIRADLHAWARQLLETAADGEGASLMRALSAAAADDRSEAELLYARLTGPAHDAVSARLAAAADAGQLRPSAPISVVGDAITGAVLYRVLARRDVEPEQIQQLVDALLDGIRTP